MNTRDARIVRRWWLPAALAAVVLAGGGIAGASHVTPVDPATVPPGPGLGVSFLAAHTRVADIPVWALARAVNPDGADVFLQHVRLGPGAATGWHTHPGPAIVTVVAGSVTYEDASGNQCRRVTYAAGQGFTDVGFGHVHRAIAGPAGADFYVVYVLPPGTPSHVVGSGAPEECA